MTSNATSKPSYRRVVAALAESEDRYRVLVESVRRYAIFMAAKFMRRVKEAELALPSLLSLKLCRTKSRKHPDSVPHSLPPPFSMEQLRALLQTGRR